MEDRTPSWLHAPPYASCHDAEPNTRINEHFRDLQCGTFVDIGADGPLADESGFQNLKGRSTATSVFPQRSTTKTARYRLLTTLIHSYLHLRDMEQTVATETAKPEWVVEAITARKQERRSAWDIREKKALEWKEKVSIVYSPQRVLISAFTRGTLCSGMGSTAKPLHATPRCVMLTSLNPYTSRISARPI